LRSRLRDTFSAGGRSFTFRGASARYELPGVAEPFARPKRSRPGARLEKRFDERYEERFGSVSPGQELIDETGTPILYTTGRNFAGRACAWIMFPDQRWLRFPVRATTGANGIMTAVDQAGNRVARYRILDKGLDPGWKSSFGLSHSIEITVHPGQKLTDELAPP
jgi:hypothetical protein